MEELYYPWGELEAQSEPLRGETHVRHLSLLLIVSLFLLFRRVSREVPSYLTVPR